MRRKSHCAKNISARTSKASERICCHRRSESVFFTPKGSHYWFARRKVHPRMFPRSPAHNLSIQLVKFSNSLKWDFGFGEKHYTELRERERERNRGREKRGGEFGSIDAVIWESKIWMLSEIESNSEITLLLLLI